jgi:hypothetical protein
LIHYFKTIHDKTYITVVNGLSRSCRLSEWFLEIEC